MNKNAYKLEAVRVPMSTKTVIFEWSFGIGEDSVGPGKSVMLPVNNKSSTKTIPFTYKHDGK